MSCLAMFEEQVMVRSQAQYRDYTEETMWDKLKRLATGRSRAQVHYDAAKDRAGDATGHMTEVCSACICSGSGCLY